jgi:hypothetical protein
MKPDKKKTTPLGDTFKEVAPKHRHPLFLAWLDDLKTKDEERMMKGSEDRAKRADKLNRAMKLLKRLEWAIKGFQGFIFCPCCGRCCDVGHAPDCELAAILEEE